MEWLLFAFGSAVFAGLTAVLSKIGVRDTDSDLATAVRTAVVLVFSWIMVFLTGSAGSIGYISAKTCLFLVLSGMATGASWLFYFRALQLGDVNKVAPIDKSSTILTMFLAALILGEGLGGMKILCMALIGTGTLMMIQKRNQGVENSGSSRWLGAALLSAAFASLTAILGKIGIQGVESNLGTAIRTCVVLAMAWLLVFLQGKQKHLGRIAPKSWCFLVISGFATGASWLCYYRALQEGPASIVVPIDKLSILVTILFSYNNSRSVPAVRRTRPAKDLRSSLSLRNIRENSMVTRMLNLSMGTTTLAGPSCRAL